MTRTLSNAAHCPLSSFPPFCLVAVALSLSVLFCSVYYFALSPCFPISLPLLPHLSLSSHLLYQRPSTRTFLLPSSHPSLSLYLLFLTPVAPSFAFFHTCSPSHLLALSFPLISALLSLCLRVISQVDWPLNIIITDSCMNKYNRLFSFLLQLKHMVWSLRDVWFHLKRTGEKMGALDSSAAQSPASL